ncbi:MAG: hypothetical protein CBC13_08590 [Planctomycetia bacterium TMED53]|nr:MAG: hypothetical protein CBC13_08590 [Planctomycetia bacterium TMED53]
MKRPLGELFGREFALIKRILAVFRRKSATPKSPPSPPRKSLPARPADKKRLKEGNKARRTPSAAPSPGGHQGDQSAHRNRAKKTPRQVRSAPVRSAPLEREIAHSPADPFASTVGSVVFHLVIIMILIPIWTPEPTPDRQPSRVVIRYLPREEPQKETVPDPVEVVEDTPPMEEPEKPEEPIESASTDETNPAPTDQTLESTSDDNLITADAEGGVFAPSRTGGGRVSALAYHGGSAETEAAIDAGIDWLMRHQSKDGSWSPDRFDAECADKDHLCDGRGYPEHRAGITGLSLLALLGNGHPPSASGSPREQAAWRALNWLIEHQDASGCIRSGPGESPRNLYDHGIATFALCESAELMANQSIEKHARMGLNFIFQSQQPGGGWDYVPSPTLRNDLSITGWQVLAIHAGRKLGHLPPPEVIAKLDRYLLRCIDHAGNATYADRGRGRGRGGYGIDAVGLLTRLTLGHSPLSSQSRKSAKKIVQNLPDPNARQDWDREPQSMYYWYTATLALFHMGGPEWNRWNSAIQQSVLPLQLTEGEGRGSWDPDPNWIGKAGGRVAQTAMGVLTFETYFRYTPLYRQLGIRR